jgi:hypothetical protein
LRPEVVDVNVLNGSSVRVSGIVDNNVDSAESFMSRFDSLNDLIIIGYIKGNGENSVRAKFLDKVGELFWLSCGGDDRISIVEGSFCYGEAKTTRRSSDKPDFHNEQQKGG